VSWEALRNLALAATAMKEQQIEHQQSDVVAAYSGRAGMICPCGTWSRPGASSLTPTSDTRTGALLRSWPQGVNSNAACTTPLSMPQHVQLGGCST
jgi:hypothetical protein